MNNLRISTMTSISSINSDIDLESLYQNIRVNDKIPYIQYGMEGDDLRYKGERKNKVRKSRKINKKKIFFNQATLHINCEKIVNLKIFNNGKIQMTGLKYEEHGEKVIQTLLPELKKIENDNNIKLLSSETSISPMNIACINSDFYIGYPIKRDILHREIVKLGYYSSYEPCIYPGVNIKYYYNTNHSNGICKCSCACDGKGDGLSEGNCKKITIAVFKSGQAIITGARKREQINVSHKFIYNFINDKKQLFILN